MLRTGSMRQARAGATRYAEWRLVAAAARAGTALARSERRRPALFLLPSCDTLARETGLAGTTCCQPHFARPRRSRTCTHTAVINQYRRLAGDDVILQGPELARCELPAPFRVHPRAAAGAAQHVAPGKLLAWPTVFSLGAAVVIVHAEAISMCSSF